VCGCGVARPRTALISRVVEISAADHIDLGTATVLISLNSVTRALISALLRSAQLIAMISATQSTLIC